ncbi:lamin tail domain-containing protein [Sandaracinus amylolyticus]|uniref:lamin tail domain-containing protein n=1 Tax=Sandaracinus amylolyticus TaxID=927083 RepID=UPI0012EDAE7D|nr:lamin tail domain-containing protein [Sandaracinus amylolyticus]
MDGGRADAGRSDAGRTDSGTTPTDDAGLDAGGEDAGDVDGGDVDGGEGDAGSDGGGSDAGDTDAGMADGGVVLSDPAATSAQIGAVRAAAGTGLSLAIEEAVVTYLKPTVATDPTGFFVQAQQTGPAIFVAVDPTTLSPAPEVGDVVSFTATSITPAAESQGRRQVATISGWSVDASGFDVPSLVQDVSSATDLVSALDDYESELVRLNGTVAANPAFSGAGHEAAQIDTAGVSDDADLRLRLPATLADELDLVDTCDFTATGPMWRFNDVAQPSVYRDTEIVVSGCPAPTVVGAIAASVTEVIVTFDRNIDPASVTAVATQFTFTGGVTASAATVMDREVTVTTSALTPGMTYTVTVSGVEDLSGTAIGSADNTATFMLTAPCALATHLVINEVDYDNVGTDNAEYVELYNPTASDVALSSYAVVFVNGSNDLEYRRVMLNGTIPAGGFVVVGPTGLTIAAGARLIAVADPLVDIVQNGAPDAVVLLDTSSNTIADAIAYEGANPMMSLMGDATPRTVAEAAVSPAGADSNTDPLTLQRITDGCDRDTPLVDWEFAPTLSPGATNP